VLHVSSIEGRLDRSLAALVDGLDGLLLSDRSFITVPTGEKSFL